MLEDRISQDLKAALLAGDTLSVSTLRSIKNALLYAKVAAGSRTEALPDVSIVSVLQKEAKKRQESADIYRQAGSHDKEAAELAEKQIIERYLPRPLSDTELDRVIERAIEEQGGTEQAGLGPTIARVKELCAGTADGATIAARVKQRLGAA